MNRNIQPDYVETGQVNRRKSNLKVKASYFKDRPDFPLSSPVISD